MKAASASEWYDTSPRHLSHHRSFLPRLSPSGSPSNRSVSSGGSSSSLPRLVRYPPQQTLPPPPPRRSLFPNYPNQYDPGSISGGSTDYLFPPNPQQHRFALRPQRQLSKVNTPTITSVSSTSFSKSYSRSSRSRSNSTEPTGKLEEKPTQTKKPPFSFSSDVRLVSGGGRVPPTTPTPSQSESESVAGTEEEGTEATETEDCYDEEEDTVYQSFKNSMLRPPGFGRNTMSRSESPMSLQSVTTEEDEDETQAETGDDEGEETETYTEMDEEEDPSMHTLSSDNTIKSFRRMLANVPKSPRKVRVKVERASPHVHFGDEVKITVELESETEASEMDEDTMDNDDEDEEEDEDEGSMEESERSSSSTAETVKLARSDTIDEVTRTEGESYGESGCESVQSESDIVSEEEERSMDYFDKTDYPKTAQRASFLPPISGAQSFSRSDSNSSRTGRNPMESVFSPEVPAQSDSYRSQLLKRAPPITRNITFDLPQPSFTRPSVSFQSPSRNFESLESSGAFDIANQSSSGSCQCSDPSSCAHSESQSGSGSCRCSDPSECSHSNSNQSGSGSCECTEESHSGSQSGTCSGTIASNSDLSCRSHSAQSSLVGGTSRASAAHKMYSVGGKLRSLSARRFPPSSPRHRDLLPSAFISPGATFQSVDSVSQSISSGNDSLGSKQNLPDLHLGSLAHLPMISPQNSSQTPTGSSRTPSGSSSSSRHIQRGEFSAALRQLSIGNLQAMNPPFSHNAANVLAERVFKGDTLPPITPSTPSEASSHSSSSSKPRPLLRGMTYTVRSDASSDGSLDREMPFVPPKKTSEHLTLRQLIMTEERGSSAGSDRSTGSTRSVNNLLFPSDLVKKELEKLKAQEAPPPFDSAPGGKEPARVNFANTVIEHSLSSEHTLESEESEQTPSTQEQPAEESSSTTESEVICRLTGRRLKRMTAAEEENLLNKDFVTYAELQQESVEDPDDAGKENLRIFALDTIRRQMEMERTRIQSMNDNDDEVFSDDYEFSEDDSEAASTEEEEEDGTPKKKPWQVVSHIPVATADGIPSGDGITAAAPSGTIPASVPLPSGVTGQSQAAPAQSHTPGDDTNVGETGSDPPAPGILTEPEDDEGDKISLLATRLNSAESGYRAMPPSRCASFSVEEPLDPEELEKLEKERADQIEQWKQNVSVDLPAISTSQTTSTQIVYGGEVITINHSRPNSASRSGVSDTLCKNGIDLTKEFPGEEKKLAVVWEEFNRDEREGGALADYEFSTLLDEMIMDVNSYKPKLTTGPESGSQSQSLQVTSQATSTSWEAPKFDETRKYTTLSELISLLSHNLRLVSAETLEDHMASLISLISSVLRKVRKNKQEDDYIAQISCLSAIRVLCDRLQEMTNSQNLKYADLSWLFRVLCKYSSDTESTIRPEASFCLAKLVKVAGPALVVRPIYFILVMESEGGNGKSTTGAKTKAAAIDTLTYAMLTFKKDEFHNLEEIAGWVCLAMLNEERRIRQSALECLAVIAQHLGGRDKALPLFHQLFLKEELDHFSRSPSPESFKTSKSSKSGKSRGKGGKGSEPIPLSVHGTVRLLTGPGFPIAQPIDAITARLDKDILPVPSTKGLIEYAVNVPTGKDLVLLMTHMLDKDDDEWDFSSSTDSLDSAASGSVRSKRSSVTSLGFSDIDWTGEGPEKSKGKDDQDLISADVAYILLGKGRVNKSDVVLLDTYKKEIIPEIVQLLEKKNEGKGRKNRKRWWKNQKTKKKRRRKGQAQRRKQGESFDDDNTFPPEDDDDGGEGEQDPRSPVDIVVNPPEESTLETAS